MEQYPYRYYHHIHLMRGHTSYTDVHIIIIIMFTPEIEKCDEPHAIFGKSPRPQPTGWNIGLFGVDFGKERKKQRAGKCRKILLAGLKKKKTSAAAR